MIILPENGSLEETPLPRLLLGLHGARFSGGLRLSRERVEKVFMLHEGAIVSCESNLASESVGAQLLKDGVISREDYAEVEKNSERNRSREGRVLLDLGLIQPKLLFEALKEQVRRSAVELFGWSTGEFRLELGAAPPANAHPFRTDVYALLQDGIENHWSSERTLTDLGPSMERYPVCTDRFVQVRSHLRSDDGLDTFLTHLDGTHTLWQAIQQATTPQTLAAVWVLDAAGGLSYGEAPKGEEAPADEGEFEGELEIVVAEAEEAAPQTSRPAAAASSGEPSPELEPESEDLLREINEKFARLDELDFYQVLGVEPGADVETIKRAYLAAAKTYHPDALARSRIDAASRTRASRVFAKIGKAHATLSDPERRKEYDISLAEDDTALDANRIATAENLYRKGEILLRQGNFKGALEFFRPCVDLWPDEAAYRSALGWVLYKKTPSEPELAREHLDAAASLDPDDGVILFRLSLVLRSLGEIEDAAAALARARRLDQ